MGKRDLTPTGVLLGAATTLERCGLARDAFGDDDGAVCTLTALVQEVVPPPFQIPWWEGDGTEAPAVYVEAVLAVNRYLGWPAPGSLARAEEQLMAWSDVVPEDATEAAEILRQVAYHLRRLIGAVADV